MRQIQCLAGLALLGISCVGMDPQNDKEFASKKNTDYWNQVDMYVGGQEHATGHLLYSRFWTNFLYDIGHLFFKEPFKKMKNQGDDFRWR